MDEELSFEISDDCAEIEIHGNEQELKHLIEIIEKVIEGKSHNHLMTQA